MTDARCLLVESVAVQRFTGSLHGHSDDDGQDGLGGVAARPGAHASYPTAFSEPGSGPEGQALQGTQGIHT